MNRIIRFTLVLFLFSGIALVSVAQDEDVQPPEGFIVLYLPITGYYGQVNTNGSNLEIWDDMEIRYPDLSPDGQRISFTDFATRALYVMNIDGSGLETVADDGAVLESRWTADGESLLYTGNGGIWSINLETGEREQLTSDANRSDSNPHISPDGTQVIISTVNRDIGDWRVDIMNIDGSERRPLLPDSDNLYSSARWSPDGTQIAMWEFIDDNREIVVVDVESGRRKQVTDDDFFNVSVSWSPDGQWLIYSSNRGDPDPDDDTRVMRPYIISLDGETILPVIEEDDVTAAHNVLQPMEWRSFPEDAEEDN